MKIIKQLLFLAAASLLISSCNKNEDITPNNSSTFPADGIIRVATNVATPQTRAGMTTDNLSQFQLRIINENNSAYSYYAWMRKSSENNWGSFIPYLPHYTFTPQTLLWQNSSQKVKVAAVYAALSTPVQEMWESGFNILVREDQNDYVALRGSDIVYVKEVEIDPSTDLVNGKINLQFKHRLSKLNLTIKMGTEFNKLVDGTANNLICSTKVEGTAKSALWNIAENTLSNYTNVGYITLWDNSDAYINGDGDTKQAQAKYEAIIIPQTLNANEFGIEFSIDDRYFYWESSSAIEFKADTQYNLTLNVGYNVVTVEGFTATPWSEQPPQDIETE